jgi:hypothetical protein
MQSPIGSVPSCSRASPSHWRISRRH